jgi:predicted RNA-binding protein YlxR (DUF448 family)
MLARQREPVRHCVACRRARPKRELLRVVRRPGGEVALDADGTAAGRGAYVCPEQGCVARAGKRLAGALKVHGDFGHLLADRME